MDALVLQAKPPAVPFLGYVAVFLLKILSLFTRQSWPQPKVSFRPCSNTQPKSLGFELLWFAFCRREAFKLQIQMAAGDVHVIKYIASLLFTCNLCINSDAKQKKPQKPKKQTIDI